jgi:hypothetical protein
MPETFTLDTTHARILQWLRHYPFQRLEDLVVALSTWSGRTTIYTHLKELEHEQFVETLRGPICSGKVLYHLAPTGLIWYLLNIQADTPTPGAEALREARAIERTTLLRLLPRIPVLFTLQTVINGLVSGAATALTQQGYRAHLVRWNWQRDAFHTFTYQGHSMRWFADGVGAFCLRYGMPGGEVQEYWYRFFLLYMPLTHPRLMRARLDRLMRWREAKERWLAYSQMPPILILPATPRQAEWWHEAAERVTHDLGVVRPLGVVATGAHLSNSRSAAVSLRPLAEPSLETSPWAWAWKRLGSQSACHLQDVFSPQHDPGFPDLFPQETARMDQEAASLVVQEKVPVPLARPRLYHLAHVRESQPRKRKSQRASLEERRRSCLDLSPRQWEILWLLLAHPLLDRGNLCAHLQLERSSLRHLLAPMAQAHLIACYETRVGERFALAEDGLRLMAAASHCHVRYLVHRPDAADAPDPDADTLGPRGLPGLLKQVEHIAGVYGFFDTLAGLGCLHWWETGSICARFYQYQGIWHGIRPDAVAECQAENHASKRSWRIWLEWDRGTMRAGELQRKMAAYARYLSSREWAREHQVPPTLLCVVPDRGQEHMLTRIALARLGSCLIRFSLYTTTRSLLLTPGISAPIWRQVFPRMEQAADQPVLLRLFSERRTEQAVAHERTS